VKKLLVALGVLIVLALAAGAGFYFYVEKSANTPIDASDTKLVRIEIVKGSNIRSIGGQLEDQGFIDSAHIWRAYWKLHPPPEPKAGKHDISRSMNMPALLAALSGVPIPDDIPITIVEGWRLRDADEKLSKLGYFAAGAYTGLGTTPASFNVPFTLPAGASLEGYIYPETYAVPKAAPIDVKLLIQRQIDKFHASFSAPFGEEVAKSGRSLHELVVMASMLEREERKPEMRSKVAGLLWKRIDKGWPLGVDATSHFSLVDWNDHKGLLRQLRDTNDPYNTRLKVGLPPGPIGAPSISSLLAALRPEASEYWFYLHDSTGTIHFGKDATEHEANRKKYNVY